MPSLAISPKIKQPRAASLYEVANVTLVRLLIYPAEVHVVGYWSKNSVDTQGIICPELNDNGDKWMIILNDFDLFIDLLFYHQIGIHL